MGDWIRWLAQDGQGLVIAIIASAGIFLWKVASAYTYNSLDRVLIPKQRRARYLVVQSLVLYALLQAVMIWLGHTGFPPIVAGAGTVIALILAVCASIIAVLWIIYGLWQWKISSVWMSVLYSVVICLLLIISGDSYFVQLSAGGTEAADYMIHPSSVAMVLLIYTLGVYSKRDIVVESRGLASGEHLRDKTLKLLYTLQENRQVLQDNKEPNLYYMHDLAADQYYIYKVTHKTRASRKQTTASRKSEEAGKPQITRVQKYKNKQIPL